MGARYLAAVTFDLKGVVASRLGENYDLHEQYVNPTLVEVFRTIGFDRVYARGEGAYLWDRDGARYLDMLGGFGVAAVGRNNPVVAGAIRDVLDMDLPNMVQMDCGLLSGLLAEAIVQRTPAHLDAVYFCNSGTESVEAAIKFARAATGRDRITHFTGGWHGLTLGALSAMGSDEFREGFGQLLAGDEVATGDLMGLERVLSREDTAAVIIECLPAHTVRVPEDGYLQAVQDLCRRHGTLLICDEVATGWGRTGRMFAFQHWGLEPGIICTSKALSGGYVPVAAMVCRRSIYQAVFSSMERCWVHSSSFGRNNLAMAAGLATLACAGRRRLGESERRPRPHTGEPHQRPARQARHTQRGPGTGLFGGHRTEAPQGRHAEDGLAGHERRARESFPPDGRDAPAAEAPHPHSGHRQPRLHHPSYAAVRHHRRRHHVVR